MVPEQTKDANGESIAERIVSKLIAADLISFLNKRFNYLDIGESYYITNKLDPIIDFFISRTIKVKKV